MGIKYAIACLLLLGVLYAIDFETTWQALSSVNLAWFAGALLVLSGSRWLGALCTHGLVKLHDMRLSSARLFEISCASTLYGLALPGALSGGLVRWYQIGQPQRRHSAATALIVFERLISFTVLAFLGVAGWFLDIRAAGAPALVWLLALSAGVFFLLSTISLSRLSSRMATSLNSCRREHGGAFEAIRSALVRTLEAAALHRDPVAVLRTVALSIAVHLVATVGLFLMGLALGLELSYATMLWLRTCIVLVTAAPLTPAGLGVRELSTVLLLGMLGVESSLAVALSVLQFVGILAFAALGAVFEGRHQLLRAQSHSVTDANATKSSSSA